MVALPPAVARPPAEAEHKLQLPLPPAWSLPADSSEAVPPVVALLAVGPSRVAAVQEALFLEALPSAPEELAAVVPRVTVAA